MTQGFRVATVAHPHAMHPLSPVHTSCALLALVGSLLTAQSGPPDQHADADGKRSLFKAVEAALADKPRTGCFTTPHCVVISRAETDHGPDVDAAKARAAEHATSRLEPMFEVCEEWLPPHEKCGQRFAICDPDAVLAAHWKLPERPSGAMSTNTVAEEFRRAQEHSYVGQFEETSVWAVYEKAWFGDVKPANWFTDLAIARLQVEVQAREEVRKGKDRPIARRQDLRDWAKLTRKDLDEVLTGIGGEAGDPGIHGGGPTLDTHKLVATFLAHGQADLKTKFSARWANLLEAYADALRAGKSDAEASALATSGVDRNDLGEAIVKWCKARAKK